MYEKLRILELRKESKTFAEISLELGLPIQRVHSLYKKAVGELLQESAETATKLEIEKLDRLECVAYNLLGRTFPVVQSGRQVFLNKLDDNGNLVLNEDGSPVAIAAEDVAPKLAAMDRILKVMERRSKLLGLDRPARTENTTTLQADTGIKIYLPSNNRE